MDDLLLEKYFARDLTPSEKAELERRLAEDRNFAAEFAWQNEVVRALSHTEAARMKAVLQTEEAKLRSEQHHKPLQIAQSNLGQRWWAAAAAALVLVAAVWFFNRPPEPAQWAADNFSAYPNKITARGGSEDLLQKTFSLYDAQHFGEAAASFAQLSESDPNPVFRFYRGVALLGDKQFGPAAQILENNADFGEYRTASFWFLALARTGEGNWAAAKTALQNYLNDPNGVPYRKNFRKSEFMAFDG